MTQTIDPDREARRQEFARVYADMPGDAAAKTARICEILGYRPHTIKVLLCRKNAWKVIPEAKLTILKRELARDVKPAVAAEPAQP